LPVVKTWVTSTVNREVAGSNPAIHRYLSDGCSSVAERHTRSLVPRQMFLIVVGGEDEGYFVERLETGGRGFKSRRCSILERCSSVNSTLADWFPDETVNNRRRTMLRLCLTPQRMLFRKEKYEPEKGLRWYAHRH
jgi:hypothetical protein